jgi:ubiquinone/menaquinone biosynthesis C-methylase UbiE
MAEKAKQLGIEVYPAVAENLPFDENLFDFVLMVTTVCFVDDVIKSFEEAYRVLKKNGDFIVAYVDKNSTLGQQYEAKKSKSKFYQEATFYGTKEILNYLNIAGFKSFAIKQTVFNRENIDEIRNGFGEGSFVAILAKK